MNIAIIGATGAVGQEMLNALAERDFPVDNLKLLAGERSAGREMEFKGEKIKVEKTAAGSFKGCDIVLGAADNDTAKAFAPDIKAAGGVFIDNSSVFRMDDTVPLVIPEINPQDALAHQGIIANPNCSTIIALTAINPIVQQFGLAAIIASTYQAVSGAGVAGLQQLEAESKGERAENPAFAHPIAYNLIPAIGGEANAGYTSEEVKMQNEGRKILHIPTLLVSCTCVRVPVLRCHSISINLRTQKPATVDMVKDAIQGGEGVELMDDLDSNAYPMPILTANQDKVYVGRIRIDKTAPYGIALWCCGDQLRKGAAVNAVQIAELLV